MKVLSIDIDFLFTEMKTYHKYMNEDIAPEKAWQCLKIIKPELTFKPDKASTRFLIDVLRKKCRSAKETFLIQEHDGIIPVLREIGAKDATVFNIDYHHDITYKGEISDLDISNWVVYGRHENLIREYNWIKQDDSDMCEYRPFRYKQDSWKDINVDLLPEFDYVVFCISKHYTPFDFWDVAKKLKSYLDVKVRNRFTESERPKFNIKDFKEFEGLDIVEEVEEAWFEYNGFYIQSEKFFGVNWLSMINIEKRKLNVLTQISEFVDRMIKKSNVGFCWNTGYKSEALIRRLSKKYVIISETVKDNKTEIILKKEEL